MKKIYKLVLISYIGPFVMTFFIALFILLMQFLWKYIDDLVGKGLEWYVVAKLLLYASASLVPLALPLAVLLSSIMTFGNLAESYELVACKSAGVSLGKVMSPIIMFSLFISLMAFLFSNYALPYTNLKMDSLLYDVSHQKPALSIKEKVFYNGIEGFSIRVDEKDKDGNMIRKVMIYDHRDNMGNTKLTVAESGKMVMSEDGRSLLITLFNGQSFEDKLDPQSYRSHPLLRNKFKEQTVRFDLSAFKMSRTNEDLFKGSFSMMNVKQLNVMMDTLRLNFEKKKHDYSKNALFNYSIFKDTLNKFHPQPLNYSNPDIIRNFSRADQERIFELALNQARSMKSYYYYNIDEFDWHQKNMARNRIEWHLKFTLSFACLVLFFIGAPLGAIIKKGGLGMPVVVSTGFFVIFHILSITGKKFAQEGVISPGVGMWMASMILLPIGIFLTYKATTDSVLFETSAYLKFFRKIIKKGK